MAVGDIFQMRYAGFSRQVGSFLGEFCMKNCVNSFRANDFIRISFFVFFLCLVKIHAQLPTGVTLVPFYDTTKVSFVKDSARTVGMWDVPGKPQHFLVLDQRGLVYRLYPDTTKTYAPGAIKDYTKGTVADFKSKTKQGLRSEMGAWGLAFHPNFLQNHYFFVIYFGYNTTVNDAVRSDGYVNVERWILSSDYQTATRDTTIFRFYHPATYGVQSMNFGLDGYLYIGTSFYSHHGWSDTTYGRKMLRIDVDHQDPGKMYAIPPSNPLFSSTNPLVKKEIYARGLRNPWSFNVDFQTGKLWVGDVGEDAWESIDLVQPGQTYGWDDGGNSEPQTQTHGVEGACPGGYTLGGAGGVPTGAGTVPANYKAATASALPGIGCADLTNPAWVLSHTATGGLPAAHCVVVGPAFRGDPSSPYYGYHFITDVWTNTYMVLKEGMTAPQVVGQAPTSIVSNTDGHDGTVQIGEDSYGNLYDVMVDWHYPGSIGGTANALPSGEKMFHEIYRLSQAQLTPRGTPAPVMGSHDIRKNQSGMLLANAISGGSLNVPAGFTGVEIHDLRGKMIWSHRGTESSVRVPVGLESGILQVRFLP